MGITFPVCTYTRKTPFSKELLKRFVKNVKFWSTLLKKPNKNFNNVSKFWMFFTIFSSSGLIIGDRNIDNRQSRVKVWVSRLYWATLINKIIKCTCNWNCISNYFSLSLTSQTPLLDMWLHELI